MSAAAKVEVTQDDLQQLFDAFERANDELSSSGAADGEPSMFPAVPDPVDLPSDDDISLTSVGPSDFPSQFSVSVGFATGSVDRLDDARPRVTTYLPSVGYTGYSSFVSSALYDDYQWLRVQILPRLGDNLISADKSGEFSLGGFYISGVDGDGDTVYASFDWSLAQLYVLAGSDSKYYSGTDISVKGSGSSSNNSVSFRCPASPDGVKQVSLYVPFTARLKTSLDDCRVGFINAQFSSNEVDESTSGLLASIIEFLKNIVSGVKNVFNAIVELPGKIVDLMVEALKSLFIPTEEQLQEVSDGWSNMLSDHLGFLWDVGDVINDLFGAILDGEAGDTIEIPSVTIPFSKIIKCADFTFGPYSVPIIPDGAPDELIDVARVATTLILLLAFINMAKNMLHKFLGDNLEAE